MSKAHLESKEHYPQGVDYPHFSFIESVQRWLNEKEYQLNCANTLFKGGEISAVMIDPSGFFYPADYYSYMIRYEAGKGAVKSSLNSKYLLKKDASCLEDLNLDHKEAEQANIERWEDRYAAEQYIY